MEKMKERRKRKNFGTWIDTSKIYTKNLIGNSFLITILNILLFLYISTKEGRNQEELLFTIKFLIM